MDEGRNAHRLSLGEFPCHILRAHDRQIGLRHVDNAGTASRPGSRPQSTPRTKGRRFKQEVDLLYRPSRRVDFLVWDTKNTPRADRDQAQRGYSGPPRRRGRICQFVRYAGKAYDGSIRYGVLATTARLVSGSSSAAIDRFHQPRREELQRVAEAYNMVLDAPPPQSVSVRNLHDPCHDTNHGLRFRE